MALIIKKDIDLDILVTKYNFKKHASSHEDIDFLWYEAPRKENKYGKLAPITIERGVIEAPTESYNPIDLDIIFDLIQDGIVEKI